MPAPSKAPTTPSAQAQAQAQARALASSAWTSTWTTLVDAAAAVAALPRAHLALGVAAAYALPLAGLAIWVERRRARRAVYRAGLLPPADVDPRPCPNPVKSWTGRMMVAVAQERETRKSTIPTPAQLESFHHAEDHDFFNESYYYNGCDVRTRDRFVTRISHRGRHGKLSYVFLLLDLEREGELSLEEDDVPATSTPHPSALGLEYVCEVPMKRWRIRYSGPMRRGCVHPRDAAGLARAEKVHVELDLVYDVDTPLFWYMRDDHPACLAGNLTQEPWGLDFLRTCIKRTADHGHYEDFGRVTGTIKVGASEPVSYDFGTFRDHSWDVRRWATMDNLCILLVALEKPLVLGGHEYWYVDLTLVDMPGNANGVARYSTGYLLGKRGSGAPKLVLVQGTSILDMGHQVGGPGYPGGAPERYPLPTQECVMFVAPHPRDEVDVTRASPPPLAHRVVVSMTGPIRRVIYWPDRGAFKVYEDYQNFTVACEEQVVVGYGTRQTGFRVGDFDPSLGGCG